MSVNVYVWKPRGWGGESRRPGEARSVGHASVEVLGSGPRIYISWWPNEADRNTLSGQVRSGLWGVAASNHRSVPFDIGKEDHHTPHLVILRGLNEAKIRKWWAEVRKKKTYWSLTNTNCSQMAVDALRAGGADKYLGGGSLAHYYNGHALIWSPKEVLRYAARVKRGLQGHG